MEFWSKGLGRRSMVINIGTEKVEDDGRELVLTGAVKAPVNWNYVIGMQKTCWDDFFSIALSSRMAGYMATPRRVSLFVKLTFYVGVFLVAYAVTLLVSTITRGGELQPAADGPDDAGLFMKLVVAGRRSSGAADEDPEDGESV